MSRRIGVTVGKFNPPHLGHLYLLERAASEVDHLYVLLGDRPDQTIPAADRAAWLSAAAPPNVSIILTPDDLPAANEPWARRALEILPESPDIGFTSEDWGPGWCAAMGADHHAVDIDRVNYPISGTRLRADLRAEFDWLIPPARAALVKRVVIAGAESTGKTTLARGLAEHLETSWVPEYGRTYWEGRRYRANQAWRSEEFTHIAVTHHRIADGLAAQASHGVLVLDTDAVVTAVWHRRYLGISSPELQMHAAANRPEHYLICAPDFAWVQDGTRESAAERLEMHRSTVELVVAGGAPFTVLEGDPSRRLTEAVQIVRRVTAFDPLN